MSPESGLFHEDEGVLRARVFIATSHHLLETFHLPDDADVLVFSNTAFETILDRYNVQVTIDTPFFPQVSELSQELLEIAFLEGPDEILEAVHEDFYEDNQPISSSITIKCAFNSSFIDV